MPLRLHFTSAARLFSRMTVPVCLSTSGAQEFLFPHVPPSTWCCQLYQKDASDGSGTSGHRIRFSETPFSAAVVTLSGRMSGRKRGSFTATLCLLLGKKMSPEISS